MSQYQSISLMEICSNVFCGVIASVGTWYFIVTPWGRMFGWDMNNMVFAQVFAMNSCFTYISIVRGWLWRRLFNHYEDRLNAWAERVDKKLDYIRAGFKILYIDTASCMQRASTMIF